MKGELRGGVMVVVVEGFGVNLSFGEEGSILIGSIGKVECNRKVDFG